MREYYLDLGFKDVRVGMYNSFEFDEDGIPRYRYPFGLFYNVSFICHFALYHYSLYLKYKRMDDIKIFLHVSKWIVEHGKETDGSFLFPYEFPWHGLSSGWISALGQGRLLSVLTRAYELSEDERYLVTARKALKPFETPVAEGGVQAFYPDGGVAFEEYPLSKTNIVLNGFITGLVGLYDLSEIEKESRAGELFNQGLCSLGNNLHRYDLGFWSAYDLSRYVASEGYHRYHIMQLWALYEMTNFKKFQTYSSRWENFKKGPRFYIFRGFSLGAKLAAHIIRQT
jgi:hypothetical protein